MHWRDQSHHLKYYLLLKKKKRGVDVRKGESGFQTKHIRSLGVSYGLKFMPSPLMSFYRYSHPPLLGTERETPLQIKISLINVIALTKG